MFLVGVGAAVALPAAVAAPPASGQSAAAPNSPTGSTAAPESCKPENAGPEKLVSMTDFAKSVSPQDPTAIRAAAIQNSDMDAVSFQPPAGFDPLTASNDLLTKFGFPVKPDDPSAAAIWTKQMQKVKAYLASKPPLSGLCTLPAREEPPTQVSDATAGLQTSNGSQSVTSSQAPHNSLNWGGMWNNDKPSNFYTSISATYKQPTFVSACTSTSGHSTWVGLGGISGRPLMQVGTDHVRGNLSSDFAFWETFGGPVPTGGQNVIPNMSVHAGQPYTAEVYYDKNADVATFRVIDKNGNTQGYLLHGYTVNGTFYPASDWYYGDPAEVIDERTYYGFLPQFTETTGPTAWSNIQANEQNAGNFPWQEVDMYAESNGQGDLLDYPEFPGGSTFTMNNRWWNCE